MLACVRDRLIVKQLAFLGAGHKLEPKAGTRRICVVHQSTRFSTLLNEGGVGDNLCLIVEMPASSTQLQWWTIGSQQSSCLDGHEETQSSYDDQFLTIQSSRLHTNIPRTLYFFPHVPHTHACVPRFLSLSLSPSPLRAVSLSEYVVPPCTKH